MVWNGGVAEVEWALFTDDVLPACGHDQVDANRRWGSQYFGQEVFEVDSEKKTKAQAICDWCNQGWTWARAKDWWEQHNWSKCADQAPAGKEAFKSRRMTEMMNERGFASH